MNLECRIIELGKVKLAKVEKLQAELAEARARNEIPDTFLIAEHDPTITTGKSEKRNKVYATEAELRKQGIDFFHSSRGGGAAYLGPGQIVFYPVVNLKVLGFNITDYLREIERLVNNVAKRMGANTFLGKVYNSTTGKEYNSVWYKDDSDKHFKFLAQGYYTINGIAGIINKGGFAVNIDKRAHQHFNLIDHCGFKLEEVGATSFEEMLGKDLGIKKIKEQILKELAESFDYTYITEREGVLV